MSKKHLHYSVSKSAQFINNPPMEGFMSFKKLRMGVLLVFLLSIFAVSSLNAQEATPEIPIAPETTPAIEVTPVAEETLATPDVTITPEATSETIIIEPSSTPEVPTVTEVPTLLENFSDNFEAFDALNWIINGWVVITDGEGSYLMSATPSTTAIVANYTQANLELSARINVALNNTASVSANGYRVLLDSQGNSRLYEGENVVATSPIIENATPLAQSVWVNIRLRLDGNTVTFTMNDVPQFTYFAPAPFVAGSVLFSTSVDATDMVKVDDVVISKIAEPASIVAVTPTPDTTVVTETPVVDVTSEVTAEVTQEVVIEVTPEVTAEATEVAAPAPVTPFLTADFETPLAGWQTSGSIVSENETNHVLLLATDGRFTTQDTLSFTAFQVDAKAKLLTPTSAFMLTAGDVRFTLSAESANLTQADVALATTAITLNSADWQTLSLTLNEGTLNVSLNGSAILSTPITFVGGAINVSANESTMIDDVALIDFAPTSLDTAPDVLNKMNSSMGSLIEAIHNGDAAAIEQIITESYFSRDEQGRIIIEIATVSNEVIPTVQAQVESLGGMVQSTGDYMLTANVPVNALIELALNENVFSIRQWVSAASTGFSEAPVLGTNATDFYSDGFNAIGAQDWHNAGVLGAGIKIGVIDSGFGTGTVATAPPKSGEYSCINAASVFVPVGKTASISSHGRNVVEVLCDIVPSATVFMYYADDYASLYTTLNRARTVDRVNVIAITLDLGADSTPGDGFGRGGVNDPYQELTLAKAEGIAVFAAAGNSGNPNYVTTATPAKAPRYYAFTSAGSAVSLPSRGSAGDIVRISWNGWSDSSTATLSLSIGGSVSGRFAPNVAGNLLTIPASCGNGCNLDIIVLAPTGKIVQVQLQPVRVSGDGTSQNPNVRINSAIGGTVVNNAGSIARPADSPDVIAVGAVCADDDSNFIALPDASVGPVYGLGGTVNGVVAGPNGFARTEVKPNIVAPSFVRTSLLNGNIGTLDEDNPGECDGTIAGLQDNRLFSGSSAATAHAAGMAALLKSNTTNTSMSVFNIGGDVFGTLAVDNLTNYMQTRSAELPMRDDTNTTPVEAPDGFDMQYGSGIAILGFPWFNIANSTNPTTAPDALTCPGPISYVGQGNFITANSGTLLNPFISIGAALRLAPANGCVVVMPGEYVTPIYVNTINNNVLLVAYDQADADTIPPSLIRVGGQYRLNDYSAPGFATNNEITKIFYGNGGIVVNNTTNTFTIRGFNFLPVTYFQTGTPLRRDSQAVVIYNADNVTIANSTFGDITIDGQLRQGWTNARSSAIAVLDTSQNVTIRNNSFVGNTTVSNDPDVASAISVANSTNVTIRNNEFIGNSNPTNFPGSWGSIIQSDDSSVNIVGNAFSANTANTLIMTRTSTESSALATRIVSNVFLNNTVPGGTGSGALMNAYYVPQLFVVNNTFVGNQYPDSALGALVMRGKPDTSGILSLQGTPTDDQYQTVDIHNNLFYNNNFNHGLMRYSRSVTNPSDLFACNDNSSATEAVTFNWYTDTIKSLDVCGTLINGNDTLSPTPDLTDFVGSQQGSNLTPNDWKYYGLLGTSALMNTTAVDRAANSANVGIPTAGNNFAAPFEVDAIGGTRLRDITNPPTGGTGANGMDIGAFEYVPLEINDINIDGNGRNDIFRPAPFPEDNGIITIDVRSFVIGGFGQIRFTVAPIGSSFQGPPSETVTNVKNFGTQCAPEFEGTTGVIAGTGINMGKLFYCPPADFYNQGLGDPNASVEFYYRAADEANSSIVGKVELVITPIVDNPLTSAIGDDNPSGDIVQVTVIANQTGVLVPLRPFATLGNLEFSEENNPEFIDNPGQVDYPFTFSGLTESGTSGGFFDAVSASIVGGNIQINAGPLRGTELITYQACDDNSNCVTNRVRVRVASTIPSEPGLYDDSSIYWNYTDGTPTSPTLFWQAVTSLTAINNTLHTSNGLNDSADFSLVGTGFVVYMQAQPTGGIFDLQMKGVTGSFTSGIGNWTLETNTTTTSNPPIFFKDYNLVSPDATVRCVARTRGSGAFLLNTGSLPYTIYCNIVGATTERQIDVKIINSNPISAPLSVDAFAILNDGDGVVGGPLAPGRYDMDSRELRSIFYTNYAANTLRSGWQEYRFATMSNAIAYRATGASTASNISFRIAGTTGFAIETQLEPFGASYTVCVTDVANSNEKCHNVDNSPLANLTVTAAQSFIPFYGYDPTRIYEVSIENIQIPNATLTTFGSLVIDSIVVFPVTDVPNNTLGFRVADNAELPDFVIRGGREDSWTLTYENAAASNRTLHTIPVGISNAGPFVAFNIPLLADSFVYDYVPVGLTSRRLAICVDRANLASGGFGNCLIVNLRPTPTEPAFQIVNPTTGAVTNGVGTLQSSVGALIIRESNFGATWGTGINGKHTVEVFSMLNESFSFDDVGVYSSTGPLGAGTYQEVLPNIRYYKDGTNAVTPGVFNATNPAFNYTSPVTDDNTFLLHGSTVAPSDSGRGIVWTKTPGASVVFGVDGTGFAPIFRLDANSDGVQVCWFRTSGALPNPATIRAANNCQTFDNQGTGFQIQRPILGLEDTSAVADYYAVAVTNLGDNLVPSRPVAPPYIQMWFDGVVVYGTSWTGLNALPVSTLVETSFTQRVARNQFQYFGNAWASFGNNLNYSNSDYDSTTLANGAGIVFRTTGANAITYRRNSVLNVNLLLCAAPETTPSARRCTTFSNQSVSPTQREVTILLNETQSTVPHIVSIIGIIPGTWDLDAIRPVNTAALLPVGRNNDNHPSMYYLDRGVNLVQNGNMDFPDTVPVTYGTLPVFWTPVGTPVSNTRVAVPTFASGQARAVVINADGQGIESRDIAFESGKTYIITARVYNDGNGGTISMNLNPAVAGFTAPTPKNFINPKGWQTFYVTFTAGASVTSKLQFTSTVTNTGVLPRRFVVDEVGIFEVGRSTWTPVAVVGAFNGAATSSLLPGAEVRFSFNGTGFSIGMITGPQQGTTEICYDDNVALSSPECLTVENERSLASTTISRSFAGLPLATYYVRVRDVEDGDSILAVNPNTPRTALNTPARLVIDYVDVFNNPLPPQIVNSVTANENYQIGGQNALQLLPSSAWRINSGPTLTTFTGNSYAYIVTPNSTVPSSVFAGPIGVLNLDLSQGGATVLLYSDAPNVSKTDQLLYCVNGFDGQVRFNYTLNPRRFELINSTKCKLINQFRTQPQAVLSFPAGSANSIITFQSLVPAPLLIDGYQVLLGTQLSPGYYESSLSETDTQVVGTTTVLDNEIFEVPVPGSIPAAANVTGNWSKQLNIQYSGGNALQLEDSNGATNPTVGTPITGAPSQFRFRIKNATGFSIVTAFGPNGGTFDVTVDGVNDFTFTGNTTFSPSFNYGVSIPFTNLPLGDYIVTVTNTGAKNLVIDAIDVYGQRQNLGSLYDDNQANTSGVPLINYGPSVRAWTFVEGISAASSLNRTFHATQTIGALATFEVGGNGLNNATGITIIYSAPTSTTNVQVCWKDLNNAASPQACSSALNLATNTTGRQFVPFGVSPVPGRYAVTIINRSAGRLQLDAVQVQETGGLTEGIYTIPNLFADNGEASPVNAFQSATTDWTVSAVSSVATSRVNNAQMRFRMRGIGFSILLNESSISSTQYSICVDRVAGGAQCDTIGNAGNPLVINRMTTPAPVGSFALTYMGLHNASGNDETYTVTLTNLDATVTRTLSITGVQILGSRNTPDMKLSTSNPTAENTDVRVRYFPFGWSVLTPDTTNQASGSNQHLGAGRGRITYIEFTGTISTLEYIRQVSAGLSDVQICSGVVGDSANVVADNSTDCQNVDNNGQGTGFKRSQVISTGLSCNSPTGCWLYVRNTQDTLQSAFDQIKLVDPNQPLVAGFYEESFTGLRDFTPALNLAIPADNLNATNIASVAYSGGFVRRYTAATTTTPVANTALNGGMFFTFTGTGFGVWFNTDTFQDEVRICYLNYSGPIPSVSSVINTGRCQLFDNQFALSVSKIRRMVMGLPQGTYAVAVQMRPDNNLPAAHIATALPLRMDIDGVQIFDEVWFATSQTNWNDNTILNPITPASGLIQPNFVNRLVDKNFLYYGTWTNVASTLYSGGNSDNTLVAGSGVVFRTANANALSIITSLGAFSPIYVCATPVNPANPLVESGARNCQEIVLTGTGNQQPINFRMGNTIDEYVVSIFTKQNTSFLLDAIQVLDTTQPLTEGFYEATDQRINYEGNYINYVPNGNMEGLANWNSVNAPTTNVRAAGGIEGLYLRNVVGIVNRGIISDPIVITTAQNYTVAARIRITTGSVQIRIRQGTANGAIIANVNYTTLGQWITFRQTLNLVVDSYFIEVIGTSSSNNFSVDNVEVITGSRWGLLFNPAYSNGSALRSQTTNSSATFTFTGTGFEIGTALEPTGGETEICYGVGTPTNCFVYQNELAITNFTTSRVVAGLPNATYVVRIRDVEDGLTTTTTNPNAFRLPANNIGRVTVDYVRIFGGTAAPALNPGSFNETATNLSGVRFIQTVPAVRFAPFTGTVANNYSDGSFTSVVGAITTTPSTVYAGPSVVVNINKVTGRGATVILYTGPVNPTNTNQVLVCAGPTTTGSVVWTGTLWRLNTTGTPANCTLKTSLRTENQILVNSNELSALSNTVTGIVRLTFTPLTPGRFDVDSIQYIAGDLVSSGISDDIFAGNITTVEAQQNSSLLRFATGTPQPTFGINRNLLPASITNPNGCNITQQWCLVRNPAAIGGNIASTNNSSATLTFNFEGTGFSILSQIQPGGLDFRVCYKRQANSTPFPATGLGSVKANINLQNNDINGIWCESATTNTTSTVWSQFNQLRFNPVSGNRYGFAYYGLPIGRYTVEVRVQDTSILATDRLNIDAVAVFGNTNLSPVLQPGLYDNTVSAFSYEPSQLWTTVNTTSQPPLGPFNRTDRTTNVAGAISQVRVNGNSVILFQSLNGLGTRDAQLCLVITNAIMHCNPLAENGLPVANIAWARAFQIAQFSQVGSVRMSPVMFYGLGGGTQQLIIENRDHNRIMSIDAILVQP
jgi:hypothetical protein